MTMPKYNYKLISRVIDEYKDITSIKINYHTCGYLQMIIFLSNRMWAKYMYAVLQNTPEAVELERIIEKCCKERGIRCD